MNRINIFLGVLVVSISAVFGCDSESNKKYDITVGWDIAGVDICESVPIPQLDGDILVFDEMEIEVYDPDEDTETPIAAYTADCTDFEFVIPDLSRGTYDVEIGAVAEHNGESLPYFQASLEVDVPSDEEYTASLSLGTGSVRVGWGFDQGFCVSNEVETIGIQLTGETNDYEATDVPCSDEIYLIDNVKWDTYSLTVQGFDADELLTHTGDASSDFEVKPGQVIIDEAFVNLQ